VSHSPPAPPYPPFPVATGLGYPHTHTHTQLPAKVTPSPARAATPGVGGIGGTGGSAARVTGDTMARYGLRVTWGVGVRIRMDVRHGGQARGIGVHGGYGSSGMWVHTE
jgi:hypothetical protein